MAISSNAITTSNVDILTVPSAKTYALTGILFCNFGTSNETVTVYARPAGAAASTTNTIIKSLVIPAGNTYMYDFKLILGASDVVTVIGTTGSVANATPVYLAI